MCPRVALVSRSASLRWARPRAAAMRIPGLTEGTGRAEVLIANVYRRVNALASMKIDWRTALAVGGCS